MSPWWDEDLAVGNLTGLHDWTIYHGRWACRKCLQEYSRMGWNPDIHPPLSGCREDAPVLTKYELKEITDLMASDTGFRIGFMDGEMSNLQADFGQLLCACITDYVPRTMKEIKAGKKPWGPVRTFQLADYDRHRWNDRSLAIQWRDAMEEYGLIVSWNGLKFDVPFLETRLRRWGLQGPAIKRHKDLLYTARYKLRLASNSLDSVSTHLGIHDKYGIAKTKMEPERWTMALGGHKPSFNYIIHHCQLDVKVLAAVWQETSHLVTEIR